MKYDIELVRQAAASQWPGVFHAIAGVDLSTLDGRHHPCPKCGGTDRFRLIDDQAGALHCNQCFSSKNGDGFAAIQWLLGCDFKAGLVKVADHLGIKPEKSSKKADPKKNLRFLAWNPTVVSLWCLKKKPIKPEAVQAIGGRVAKYRDQYTVIAIPTWGPNEGEDPIGWTLYRADGGELPKWVAGSKKPQWVKVKLTAGSQPGVIRKERNQNESANLED